MNRKYIITLCLLIVLIPVHKTQSSPLLSLKGISVIAVRVDKLPDYMNEDGIKELEIIKNIEKQLKEKKIRIVDYQDWGKTLGAAYINIKIVPSKSYIGDQYVIYTQLEVIQPVTLIRPQIEHNRLITANTWSAGKLVNCSTESVDQCLGSSIYNLVELFAAELKKMN